MNNFIDHFHLPPFDNVRIVYIRVSSFMFYTYKELSNIKELAWVDSGKIMAELLQAGHLTDPDNFSIIAIYEKNKSIKTFMNIGHDFHVNDLRLSS